MEQQKRSLHEEYLRDRPQGYSYCSFCLYLRREKEVKVPVGRIDHIAGDQMYVDFAGDKLYIADRNTGDKFPWKSLPLYFLAARLRITKLYHRKRKNILSRHVKMPSIILEVYPMP